VTLWSRHLAGAVAVLAAAIAGAMPSRASVLDSWIGPHEFRVLAAGTELEFVGGISGPALTELARLLEANPRIAALQLTSQGGDALTAMGMEQLVRQRGLITYVPRFCASACAFVFMGGRERYLGPGARLGFHAAAGLDDSAEATARLAAAARSWMLARGVADAFVDRAVSTPSSSMWYPSRDELVRAGVLTAATSPWTFASPSFGNGLPSLLRTTATRDDPLFVATKALTLAIKRADSGTFETMQASLDGALSSGTYDPTMARAVSDHVSQTIQRAMAIASDESVERFAAARSAEMDQLAGIDPAVCVELPSVTSAQRDAAAAAMPPEINLREIEALTDVLNSSIDRPQRPPSLSGAKADYGLLMQSLTARIGSDVQYLTRPELQPARTCELRNTLLKWMLAQEPRRRSALLRAALSGQL
jgi:hypothetical protein